MEVLILEERTGRFVVTDSAARAISLLSDRIDETIKNNPLAPAVILGVATNFGIESDPPRMVGILYGQGGVMFTSLDDKRILAFSASPTESYSVMRAVNEGLPALKRRYAQDVGKEGVAVTNASDAEATARSFLLNDLGSARIRVEGISFDGSRWSVSGVFPGTSWIPSRRFSVDVAAVNGAILKYDSKGHSWNVHDLIGLILLASTLGLVGWVGLLLYVIFK